MQFRNAIYVNRDFTTRHSPQLKQGDSFFFHHCIGKYLTVLQCLTQCPQAMFILFPYALRYSFSSLCRLHLQCFFQNINACIRIPVMNCMAFRTLPDTNAQIFYPWISVAARAAGLTARIHHWYSLNFISIPDSFIFQHFEKRTAAAVGIKIRKLYRRACGNSINIACGHRVRHCSTVRYLPMQ